LSSSDYGEVVSILVGPEGSSTVFAVHKDKLTLSSKFMKAAFSKSWVEGQQKIIKLPEEDPTPLKSISSLDLLRNR
jgi:hypothetical protein